MVSLPVVCDHLFATRVLPSWLSRCLSPSVSALSTLSLLCSASVQTPLRPPYICRETIAIRTAQYGRNPPIWACKPQPVDRRAEGLPTTAAESHRLWWCSPGRLTDGRCAAVVLSACWGLTTTPCQGIAQASNEMVIRYLYLSHAITCTSAQLDFVDIVPRSVGLTRPAREGGGG